MQSTRETLMCDDLVPANYLNLAQQAQNTTENAIKELLEKRKLPQDGWSEILIEQLVHRLAAMDSNNFSNNIGFGEREARIICPLVARRHYHFGHGIGRSGNLAEAQPKAAGSTLMANLTNALLLDLLHHLSLTSCQSCILVPMATGMTLMLCMLALKKRRPRAKYVLWSRIDQKSCFKSITTAGLIPIIIETKFSPSEGDNLSTNVDVFEQKITEIGSDNILCILSTTSCFAPRNYDEIYKLGQVAAKHDIPHLVNNAYGLQCKSINNYLELAQRSGRVDLFVQSTDKNLMVPVGGAIIAGKEVELVQSVAGIYAGRASSSQTLDVFMTLLSLGKRGYTKLMKERMEGYKELQKTLQLYCSMYKTELLPTNWNDISIAVSLKHLKDNTSHDTTKFGSMLYSRGVSGARVIVTGEKKVIDGYEFQNWGAHNSDYCGAYITFAAAIGMQKDEIEKLKKKLIEATKAFLKESNLRRKI